MTESQWLALLAICLLGAMSPGPSLAVVVRHSLAGGHSSGIFCALAHGVGIYLWAMLMVSGLGVLMLAQPAWLNGIRIVGAAFLLYLGARALMGPGAPVPLSADTRPPGQHRGGQRRQAVVDGIVIALSNPKIAFFFAALFSQFVKPDAPVWEKHVIAMCAAVIDAAWYALVSLVLSGSAWVARLHQHAALVNQGFGVLLIALAFSLVWHLAMS